ncbi:unnamed protein product [Thlaspi arvense]|uniref:Uncharacterized protein n=1 Tax=Thlaspi arvense TaxID=13288 RepID=A0AAU9T4V7_THLAR|nr:unnamed protein product [Thlaspi arvense]
MISALKKDNCLISIVVYEPVMLSLTRLGIYVPHKVGILRPNWLDGAKYLGKQHVNGFHCNVWEKVDFIWYYEDVETKRPVQWIFYTGREAHVMTYEVGAVLEDEKWQAPVYCFNKEKKGLSTEEGLRGFKGYKDKAAL